MHPTKMLFICIFSAVPIFANAQKTKSDCVTAIEGVWYQFTCNESEGASDQLDCINSYIDSVERYCITETDGFYSSVLEGWVTDLENLLIEKSNAEEDTIALAKENSYYMRAQKLLILMSADFKSIKNDVVNQSILVNASVKEHVDEYRNDLNNLVSSINNTHDYLALVAIENKIQIRYLEFSKNLKLSKGKLEIALGKLKQGGEKSRLLFDTANERLSLGGYYYDIGDYTDTVSSQIAQIELIDNSIYQKTDWILFELAQKILTMRYDYVDELSRERFQEIHILDKASAFLSEANDIVVKFQKNNKSSYYQLPYLTENYEAANELLQFSTTCEIGNLPEWKQLGCDRLLAYKTNAINYINSTAIESVSFLVFWAGLFEGDEINNKVDILNSILQSGDNKSAVTMHDAILTEIANGV